MASNPYVNKVEYAGQTLMDLTGDTVTPSDVLAGATFHDRSGSPQTGNLITHNVYDGLDSTSTSDALSANQGKVLNSHFFSLGTSEDPVTDLGTIPLNGIGGVVLAASISPSGVLRNHSCWKTGMSQNRYVIYAVDQYSNQAYYQVCYSGTLQGWKKVITENDIVDDLISSDTNKALSANQGKELKGLINILRKTNNIGEFSTESELSAILNTEISSMDTWSNKTIMAIATDNITGLFINGYIYYGILFKGSDTNNYCHVLFYSNASTNVISGYKASSSSWTFLRLATTDTINTAISNLENSHFGTLGNPSDPVTSRNSIPLNWVGNVTFDTSVSPSGYKRSHSVIKFGLSETRYCIIAIDQYANKMYLFENYDGTIMNWRSIEPQSIFDLPPTSIPSNATLSSYNTPGSYYVAGSSVAATISDCPYKSSGGRLEVLAQNSSTNYLRQIYYPAGNINFYMRLSTTNNTWGNWHVSNLTQV